ncbi:MAG: iron ABC transporter permease [Burkholderiaceae bacterium]
MNARSVVWAALLTLLLGIVALASVGVGNVVIAPRDVFASLAIGVGFGPDLQPPEMLQRIVMDLRLPRALLALLVGAGLSLVGALLQTVTRNDLADPFLFGLSSGAAAGAVAVISITGDALGRWTLPAAAFAGGMIAVACVLLVVRRSQGAGPERLVLAGLAVSFLFSALTHYLVFAGDQRAAHSVLFWSLGGLGLARWDNLPIAMTGFAVLFAYGVQRRHALDALLAGDATAHSLGVNPTRVRTESFIVCAFATSTFVALAGVIGFVGLMVPHLARALGGALHSGVLLSCALLGALLLLASDVVSRTLLAPQELPVGLVTASIGALFVSGMRWRRPARDR